MTISKKLAAASYGLLFYMFAASNAFGQGRVNDYNATTFAATWTDISSTGTSFSLSDIHGYNDGYATLSLPFAFTYDSTAVSSGSNVTVSAGGAITLGSSTANYVAIGSSSYPATLGYFNGEGVDIGVDGYSYVNGYYYDYWGYLHYTYGYVSPVNTDYYEVDGSSPNQVFTIQLHAVHFEGSANYTDMQVKFYESTKVIEFIYDDHSYSIGTDYYETGTSIGLNGFTSPSFTYNSYATNLTSTPSTDLRFTPPTAGQTTRRMTLSRSSIALGQVRLGSRKADSLKVSSNGDLSITISSAMRTGTLFSRFPTSSNRSISAGTSEMDSAIFTPTSRGTFNDSLIFTTNSDTVPQQRKAVYVSGQGVQAIFTATNGTALSFGNLHAGRTAQQTFNFSNTGDDTLFLQTPTFSGSGFTVFSSTLTVPPSQTGTIVVQFAPTARQAYSATMTLTALNGITVPSVALSGNGILPLLQISNAAPYGTFRVGQTLQGTVTFTNTGNDTLHLSGASLTQPSTRFTLTTYDQSVLPGATGIFHISYAPNQRRLDTAFLHFTTDDPTHAADTVTVTGRGIQAIFLNSANVTTIFFGHLHYGRTAQQTFAFSNSGDDTLFLQMPTISSNAFTISGGPILTIAPNRTDSVVVQFAPAAAQIYVGTLTFTASNFVTAPSIGLSGIGTSPQIQVPAFVAFGPMRVGLTLQGTITFRNTGTYDSLNLSNLSLAQLTPRFTVEAYDQMVAPGATGTIHIGYTPNVERTDSAQLHITSDDITETVVTVTLIGNGVLPHMAVANNRQTVDLGQVRVNGHTTHDFAVTNNGSWDLNLLGATASPAPFSVVSKAAVIGASITGYVTVGFAPTATGRFTGSLVITGDDPSNPSDTIFLTGTGINSDLAIDPVNVDFGTVPVLTTLLDTIELSNSGTASVNINSYTLSPLAGTFAIVNSPPSQVSAGGTGLVIVSFRPDAAGNYAGTLTLRTDDAQTPVRTINLSGVGVKGALSVTPLSIDFGNVTIGQDSTIQATVTNTGQAIVAINSVTMTGSAFSSGTFVTPLTVGVGQTVNLNLTFTPTVAGTSTGLVSITLVDNTLIHVPLTGFGVSLADVATVASQSGEYTISVSPNPASSSVTAHISMSRAADGRIELFDATGHAVVTLSLGLLSEGVHDVSLPIENLASGSYFVRITNMSGESASARLILER